jgi:RHS repeat-associated protein
MLGSYTKCIRDYVGIGGYCSDIASNVVSLAYTYDDNNNITSITNRKDDSFSLTSLTYDGLDRLITTSGEFNIGSSAISYDSLGNIRSYSNNSMSNPSDLTYDYGTNGLNRLRAVTTSDTTGAIVKVRDFSAASSYDARGNVKSNGNQKGINSFKYNLVNQMTEAGGNQYIYDGYNRRIMSKKADGKTSYSMYSQSGKLLYRETDKGGINYIYLGSKLVAKEGNGVTPPNAEQGESSIANYKPFGESIETPQDDVGYTGHKFDKDLGLSYMQARYYDPVIGRFYSNDPVGFTNVHTFNRYAYANNNPYRYTDPTGQASSDIQQLRNQGFGSELGNFHSAQTAVLAEASGYNCSRPN